MASNLKLPACFGCDLYDLEKKNNFGQFEIDEFVYKSICILLLPKQPKKITAGG